MTRTVFEKVARYATHQFQCEACNKPCRRSKEFWQTLSPFNQLPDGTVKSRQDIWRELDVEAAAWRPTRHAKCEE